MYALVDCNNFYCSCERVFNPKLEGKPVVVLSNNDGCAIARSEEAKSLGISMGTPAFMLQPLIKKHDIIVFSSNYTLYHDMSDRVMSILSRFVPRLEISSIDEAYLDLHDVASDLLVLAMQIRKTIKKEVGIPVSIGIGPTKTLAKMANHYAKKHHRDIGVYYAATAALIECMLKKMKVDDVCGIGHRHALKLNAHRVTSALDFVNLPTEWIRTNMSVVGVRLQNELKGIPAIENEYQPQSKKNICHSRSFGHRLTEKKDLAEAIANYAANCALKLRQQNSCCQVLNVFIQTNPHKTNETQYVNSIDIHLERPSNNTVEIMKYALKGLDLVFKQGLLYMKAGVTVMQLIPEDQLQSSMFDEADLRRNKKVMQAVDGINKLLGKDKIKFAAQGVEKTYSLQAAHLSPRYTTNIHHVLNVRI